MTYTNISSLFGWIGTCKETGDNFRISGGMVVGGKVFGVWLVGGPHSGRGVWVDFDNLTNLRKGN